ncbi:hypothetical protein [uncultured Aquimarina sp.]|uniref:hypothetical protein n=1 Tax=uncultured Aquimarina sp. TaxID=575652 RepID=UPI00262123DC|nr:hypothetical protein [uncultured Aquimarina sp.]
MKFSLSPQNISQLNEIRHEVLIKHPGEKTPVKIILKETRNEEGLAVEYTMDVESVICLEEVCKVIPVTLYWNNIGEYQQYMLQEGTTLEKYEADLFEPEDYKKLHAILMNGNSPFKDVYLEEVWNKTSIRENDIDAISGATILKLDDEDTISGAALTCYTLWHWANGDVVSIIKNKTGRSASIKQLKTFILHKGETYFDIAIEALEEKNNYSTSIIDIVIERVLKDDNLTKKAFLYIDKANSQTYLQATSTLFLKGKKEVKLAAVLSLNRSEVQISKLYLDLLSKAITKLDSFQEVSAILDLMENKNPSSPIVIANVIPLLDSDFLIARRSYWFLKNQNLTTNQKERISSFYKNNKHKL